ncbi:MAG: tRNA (guanosine(37)-N1)-methyltransferase TrmD [Clostridia bacterium]|nr:tRNA (guanosine(37)-N1)-methyltransferase TrmD [Clostridia bacterium]
MRFDVMTLFPDMVRGVLSESIIGRAQSGGLIEIACHDIREFSKDKHRKVDDTPYGGGVGMVMSCQPIYDCYESIANAIPEGSKTRVIYMSPKGRMFSHSVAKELSEYDNLIFLCGHYEGVDQRVIDEIVDEEISIGDYVVTGGEIPACIVIDAVSRLLDGVLASSECYEGESVASGILEYPQYTKPREFRGREVPEILLSGDHAKIDRWRLEEAVRITKERRPDMLLAHPEIEESLKPKKKRRVKNG